jgi:hypothetical protein
MKTMPFIGLAILLLLATGSAHNELENSYRRGPRASHRADENLLIIRKRNPSILEIAKLGAVAWKNYSDFRARRRARILP